MQLVPPKFIGLDQLTQELAAAGIVLPMGLGTKGHPATEVFTYASTGEAVELSAAAQTVVTAHVFVDTAAQIRAIVVAAAQSAVGVQLTALTVIQQRALLAVLLNKAGGVSPANTILPLAQWAN